MSSVAEAFDLYLSTLCHRLVDCGIQEDLAYVLIFETADALRDAKLLPQFPCADTILDTEYLGWLGRAKAVRFDALVLRLAAIEGERPLAH